MGSIPFAFSVHHFVNSVGAYAGFASLIGLAILVLLYFAQARETASLRDRAAEWAQRVEQLEAHLASVLRRQSQPAAPPATQAPAPGAAPAPSRAPLPTAAPATAAAGAAAASATHASSRAPFPIIGPPAGVGAPALTAATKLIPTTGAAVMAPEGAPETPRDAVPDPADLTVVGAPAPATVAGGANGHSDSPPGAGVPPSMGRTAVAAPPAAPGTFAPPSLENTAAMPPPDGALAAAAPPPNRSGSPAPPPRIQIRPGASTAPGGRGPAAPARKRTSGGRRRPSRVILAGVLTLLVIGGIVAGVLLLTRGNGSGSHAKATAQAQNTTAAHRSGSAAVTPASLTVTVLNGTAISQLAHRVSQKLSRLGYKPGKVDTAADQTRTATVVAYLPGHRAGALAVASSLKLGPASVQAVDQTTRTVACPPPSACTAQVIVTAGTDLGNI
ncbi:MAG: LytR C-terminal domain-containing protein [Solirubrobacterales bacterium]|nr:LytR C-terminal domain-containing protein [Solirubrobacterales bacterium]